MKFICAPMATLSHEAFRRIIEQFGGPDEYYTEMINAGSLLTRGPFEKYYLYAGPVPQKIVWQLTGKDSEHLAAAAQVVASHGGIGVDLNMGCSAPEIIRSGAGIAWMCKPLAETRAMVRGVRSALEQVTAEKNPLRLSVKLRLGDEDFSDSSFFSFCDMLVEEGVECLTLHPRTRKEKYRKPPKWEYVEKLAMRYENDNVSVVLNGAVSDSRSAAAALAVAPHIDGIMIGRAAVQKPWIFAEIKGTLEKQENTENLQTIPACRFKSVNTNTGGDCIIRTNGTQTQIDLLRLALEYIENVEKYQPPEFWKTRLQRFFSYYCDNFSFAHYAKTQMLNSSSVNESRERITAYFEKVPEDRYKAAPFLM